MKLNLDLRPEELQRNTASLDWREYLLLISSVLFVLFVGVGLFAVGPPGAWTAGPVSTSFVLPLSDFGLNPAREG